MNSRKNYFILLPVLFLAIIISCKHESDEGIDREMYEAGRKADGFTWYKNSSEILNSSSISGHSDPRQRTRYNSVASAVLTPEGKVMEGISFPEGSLIVKELYKSNGDLNTYAMLYKKPSAEEADDAGWVWGYFDKKGKPRNPASEKGASCRSCHSQSGSIDYSLMNLAHP